MQDKTKLYLLVMLSVCVAGLFIGVGLNADNYQYFLSRRIPKVLAMILAGVAIAQSSVAFQTITHNRILTPSIMGFDALYLLAQVLVVVTLGTTSYFTVNAYANFALSTTVMVGASGVLFWLYFRRDRPNLMVLLLVGIVIGAVLGNIASFFTMLMSPNDFAALQSMMFASFNNVKTSLVYVTTPLMLFITWRLFRYHRVLDVFWLDQDNATSLGVDVFRITRNVLLLSAIMIAISTAIVGPVLFFGLLISNLTREWFRTFQHRILLFASSAMAVCTLLSGQWVVEKVFAFNTTLSVIINFIGGIYFLSLLLRNKVV
ncbi:iron chelate uptake ABC transporter family permease subunit [Vibrio zhugei]|uniref:Iron chelate uptake ABC transporter family permease subunit n=1 Tax=Vibrio zhugei TaxID=2479546 RepID=A0ABV7C944_9VIBR|nr:iron chelate uptake ABC transporter family permease subunit [Vibrio zhugei]